MRRALQAIAAATTLAVLSGCGGAATVQDDWHARATHAPLAARHFEIPEKDLNRVCGIHGAGRAYGCAIRVAAASVCIIYTAPKPAAWVMEHEHKHCAGWDHSPHPYGGTAVAAASVR